MWFILGILAIVTTTINLIMYFIGKDYKLWMAMGISLTALTLCAEYSLVSNWVDAEDWGALADDGNRVMGFNDHFHSLKHPADSF